MGLAERYRSVQERIRAAERAAGRDSGSVELIVVTKNHPAQLVLDLHDLGQRSFGENRDQEARPKALEVSQAGTSDADWHFVGQLQSNKVKSVLEYASCIHSIDRASLVRELRKQLSRTPMAVSGFIELNLTDDLNRGGVAEGDLLTLAESLLEIDGFNLLGVMAVASLDGQPGRDFERAVAMSEQLKTLTSTADKISMGMSDDFEIAISMGATHIRVGSAITGPRPTTA
jgi:pyridoxal phosphate enzyme (YggS family)